MGILDRIKGMFSADSQARSAMSLQSAEGWLLEGVGAHRTASGIDVTPDKAMRLSAVSACVRLLSQTIASLPVHVYIAGTKSPTEDVPASALLRREPNMLMTSFVFREMLVTNLLLYGNAYAMIVRVGGEPVELLPIDPRMVVIRKAPTMGLVYDVRTLDGRSYTVPQADMLHAVGPSFDGIVGVSPIKYAAQSIGLGLAAEQFGAALFGNGSMPSGYLSMPGKLTPEQMRQMRDSWYATYGGLANAQKTAVLFENAKFEPISIPPDEAQFLETRKFQTTEIARWFLVPPHKIADLERSTNNNIEHQGMEFVTQCLVPWLRRFEEEFDRKLFPTGSDGQKPGFYVKFNVDGLLRGDIKSRSDYYIRGRQWGWLSVNDIRALEDLKPIDNGDVYLSPMNMVPAGQDEPAQQEQTQ